MREEARGARCRKWFQKYEGSAESGSRNIRKYRKWFQKYRRFRKWFQKYKVRT
jgi:hypothetical protein